MPGGKNTNARAAIDDNGEVAEAGGGRRRTAAPMTAAASIATTTVRNVPLTDALATAAIFLVSHPLIL